MANVLEVLQAAGLDVEAEPGWETPDHSTFPDDASEEKPYRWDAAQGAWVTLDNLTENL